MPVDRDRLDHVLKLARLDPDAELRGALLADLDEILGYVEQVLAAEDEPHAQAARPTPLRPDVPEPFEPDPLLQSAPRLVDGLVVVPPLE